MLTKSRLTLSLSLTALSVPVAPALAQTPHELEPVVVSATRTNSVEGETPQKITIITREEIENQLAITNDPSELLSNLIPSYSPSRQKLTNSGVTLRGREPLFLIDGVPQSNPLRDSARDAHTIDLAMIERIEVIYGASAEHGLGATGGIINFVTRRPEGGAVEQHAGVSVTAPTDYESDGLGYGVNYRIGGVYGSWDYLAAVNYRSRGLFYDAEGRPIGVDTTQGDLMDSRSYDILLKLGYWLDDNQNLELMVNRFALEGNYDYVSVPGDREQGIPTTSIEGTPEGEAPFNKVLTTSLTYRHDDLADHKLLAQFYSQRFRGRFGGGRFGSFQDPSIAPEGTLFDQTQNESDKLGAKFTLSREGLFDNHLDLTGGIDLLQDETQQRLVLTDRVYVPPTTFHNYAPFLQAELRPIRRLLLQGGVRHEYAELDVDTFQTVQGQGGVTVEGGNPTFEETLFNAGVVFQATDAVQLFANYSEGFGMPDIGRVLRGIGEPNQDVDDIIDLQPILTDNREVGLRTRWAPLDFELSYFESDAELGSRLVNVGGVWEVRRQPTEIRGVELTGGFQVNDAHRLEADYAKIEGEYDADGDGEVETDLTGIDVPPDQFSLRWLARWSAKLNTLVQVSYFFDREFDDPQLDFDGYALVDISLGYRLPIGRLSVGVANLLNEDYITYYSQAARADDEQYFAGRGRVFTIGYEVDF